MPHVDELLGITTLASMGLLVAVSLQPVESTERAAAVSAEKPLATATQVVDTAAGVVRQPVSSVVPAATVKERT
jgi:hypothetical protein